MSYANLYVTCRGTLPIDISTQFKNYYQTLMTQMYSAFRNVIHTKVFFFSVDYTIADLNLLFITYNCQNIIGRNNPMIGGNI